MGRIIRETLRYLIASTSAINRHVVNIRITNYYTLIELDDGSVGACLSDFILNDKELQNREIECLNRCINDKLLLEFAQEFGNRDGVARAIGVAVTSALSAPIIKNHGDSIFFVRHEFPEEYFNDIENAVLIGFGGVLEYLLMVKSLRRLHISDLRYPLYSEAINRSLAKYRQQHPDVKISISDGSSTDKHLQKADFVSITGSTLGNNTLENLLEAANMCDKVLMQGQSAAIHPKFLYKAGVNLVATTLKPRVLIGASYAEGSGVGLEKYMENGCMPPVFLWPKMAV